MKIFTSLALLAALSVQANLASAHSNFEERQRAYSDRYIQNEMNDVSGRLASENIRILKRFGAFISQNSGTSSPISCDAIKISIYSGMVTQVMLGASARMSFSELAARHRDHVTYNCEANLNNGSACRLSANTDWTSFISGYDNRRLLNRAEVVCFDSNGRRKSKRL
jgi:hypothetical protein